MDYQELMSSNRFQVKYQNSAEEEGHLSVLRRLAIKSYFHASFFDFQLFDLMKELKILLNF